MPDAVNDRSAGHGIVNSRAMALGQKCRLCLQPRLKPELVERKCGMGNRHGRAGAGFGAGFGAGTGLGLGLGVGLDASVEPPPPECDATAFGKLNCKW